MGTHLATLRRMRNTILVLTMLSGTFVACESEGCTLLGCEDSITLTFVDSGGDLITETVTGTFSIDGTPYSVECSDENSVPPAVVCNEDGSVSVSVGQAIEGEVSTLSAEFDVQTQSGSASYMASTEVMVTQHNEPNGPGCPPVCSRGQATITLQ